MPPIDDLTGIGAAATQRVSISPGQQVPELDAATKLRSNARTRSPKKSSAPRMPPAIATALVLIVCAVIACATILGFKEARRQVHTQERFHVPLRSIEFTSPPVWIRGDLVAEVQRIAGLDDPLSTLDPNLAGQVHDAFASHPWVREVSAVRIIHPATVLVKLAYREPVLIAQTGRSIELVDAECVLLPAADLPEPRLYLTVTGVRSTPTGPIGTKWDDPALLAAVSLATTLSPHHRTLGLTTIDVSSFRPAPGQGPLYLLTEQGTRVKWGRPPDVAYPGEIAIEDKLDRLQKYVAEHGSLDDPAGPYEIDITHWQEVSIRPRGQPRVRGR